MDTRILALIYELKGIVTSLADLADLEEAYHNPLTERIESKLEQMINLVEEKA
ncbi:hypothetical protein [Virgibacillus sp. SK37]|uniref:hypothetical protein n=1 Tax=Virgibacillus sp. SK37 TaxID=403957 RepID=UPI0004D1B3B6|nr:hypothetical protein [Virgibacillus sp. SK37]AIF45733.1 hypothetical protein X953_19855 [Virgibacillus sp. SK37]